MKTPRRGQGSAQGRAVRGDRPGGRRTDQGALNSQANKDIAMKPLTEDEKKIVVEAVKNQFDQLVSSINQIDTKAWASFYSDDSPVTTIAGIDFFGDKKSWVETVGKYFSQRKSQIVEPMAVRITPLAHDLALLVSEENTSMTQGDGSVVKSKHVFTMVWKNEKSGWKVLHSHESWIDY